MLEPKEKSPEADKVDNDLNAMNIIHELAESTNIQAATHKKEADVNQLYAKANVLLVQTNNDLSKSIISLNNSLSQARITDSDKLVDQLNRIDRQFEELMRKVEKIETVSEKIERSIIEMISKDGCSKKNQ